MPSVMSRPDSASGLPSTPRPMKPYPHIDDLKLKIDAERPNQNISIRALLILAEKRWMTTMSNIEFRRLDLAYVDYNVALNILVDLIPRNKEYPTFAYQSGDPFAKYKALQKEVYDRIQYIEEIKTTIIQNNTINKTISSVNRDANIPTTQQQVQEAGDSTSKNSEKQLAPEIRRKPQPPSKPEHLQHSHQLSSDQKNVIRSRPSSSSGPTIRPQSSQGLTNIDGDNDDLQARFQKIRIMNGPNSPTKKIEMPMRKTLMGPREMPGKAPLSLDFGSLPKPPSPTYSPVRQFPSSTSDLSMNGPVNTRPMIRSLHSSSQVNNSTSNGLPGNAIPRKPVLSRETQISSHKLADYLMNSSEISLLVLDVRNRSDFDQGHIFARNIVCIEPIILREGMSADQLEDALAISPDGELRLFLKRHTFDIVVYYDQSSRPSSPNSDDSTKALRILVQAIHEYAYSKSLKSPPMMLDGGLDEWIDENGVTSLVSSNSTTAHKSTAALGKLSRTNAQTASLSSSALAQRRKEISSKRFATTGQVLPDDAREDLKVMVPFNTQEQQEWLERLKRENEPITISPKDASSPDEKRRRRTTSIVAMNPLEHPLGTEEFFRQFSATNPESVLHLPMPDREPPPAPVLDDDYQATVHAYPALPKINGSYSLPFENHVRFEDKTPPAASESQPGSPGLHRRNTIIDHVFHGFTDVRNPEFNPPPSPSRPPPAVPRKSYSGVSERPQPFAPALDANVASLAPPIPPKLLRNPSQFKTGLKNLGNTCYMNSIIQCMSGTIPLARYFLAGSYKMHINKENKLGSKGIFAEAFANLIRHLWEGDLNFVSPVTFKELSGRLNSQFKGKDQQDAQEYLDFFLDALHEDLNPNANRQKFPELTEAEERRREAMPIQLASYYEWQRYTNTNSSVIVNWFQGQIRSRLQCMKCGHTSTTYNAFMYLSLPIPNSKAGVCSLDDCMKDFTKEEILDGDDAWHCPICKKARKASKQLSISRMPHVLIIHLKRFSSNGMWRDKINTLVKFSSMIDLTTYGPRLDGALAENKLPIIAESTPPFKYSLYAVANHYGSLTSGHYTAFVGDTDNQHWSKFDDSKATPMDPNQVVSRNAYVLFWVRKNVM